MGTDMYFYGSVLAILVRTILPGPAEDNLEQVWLEIKAAYKDMRISSQFQNMKLSMFERGERFPMLKGKGAEVRHLGRPLLRVFQQHMDAETRQHKQIKMALDFSVQIEEILDVHEDLYALPTDAAKELSDACYAFCGLVTAIGRHYHDAGIQYFNFTIKSHYLLHIALLSMVVNPRLAWCYKGEDFMQIVQKIIAASVRGTPAYSVEAKTLRKYANGLNLKFRPEECYLRTAL